MAAWTARCGLDGPSRRVLPGRPEPTVEAWTARGSRVRPGSRADGWRRVRPDWTARDGGHGRLGPACVRFDAPRPGGGAAARAACAASGLRGGASGPLKGTGEASPVVALCRCGLTRREQGLSRSVTTGHGRSRSVTAGHAGSRRGVIGRGVAGGWRRWQARQRGTGCRALCGTGRKPRRAGNTARADTARATKDAGRPGHCGHGGREDAPPCPCNRCRDAPSVQGIHGGRVPVSQCA